MTMDADRRANAVTMLRGLRGDIEVDIKVLEGQPFTGKVVSTYLGNLAAAVDALANVLIEVLDKDVHSPPFNPHGLLSEENKR